LTSGEVGKPSLDRKKLIEVALPLSAINAAAVAEKDVHTGHPANLHTWWARRPLATARAILFASIVDDPAHEGSVEGGREARQRLFKLIEKLCTWESTNKNDLVA